MHASLAKVRFRSSNIHKTHQDIYGYIAVGFSFLLLTLITVKTFAPEVKSEAANQTASQTVGPYTMSMANDSVATVDITPTNTQTVYTATNNLSVTNTCDAGATITMTTNSTSSNSLTRSATNSDTLTKDIAATTTTGLDNNSWGYALNDSSTYYAVPKKGQTAATVYNEAVARTSAYTVPIKFGVKTDNNLPSGTYSNDVVYTMMPKSGCNSYSVTWNYDGGTAKSGVTYPTSLSWGQTVNLSTLTPTKSGYTFAGWTNGTSTFTGSETAANLNSANAKSVTVTAQWRSNCTENCTEADLSVNESIGYDYQGKVVGVTLKKAGYYKLEVWGAQGGGNSLAYGGYSYGDINLSAESVLYIYVGGSGATKGSNAGGGGGTDIRTVSGNWYSADGLNSRLIVAGGGGGKGKNSSGGSGGGLKGGDGSTNNGQQGDQHGNGGTQSAGGTYSVGEEGDQSCLGAMKGQFGFGGSARYVGRGSDCTDAKFYDNITVYEYMSTYGGYNGGGAYSTRGNESGGGGGGWYGGGASGDGDHGGSGGGGSGYIGNSLLLGTKRMYQYSTGCTSSTATATYTVCTSNTGAHVANAANTGNGYAKITYLGTSI